jgi:ComF family protein
LAGPLGELMAEVAARELDCESYDYVIPVPLHKVRYRERGYNQSRLLAQEVLRVFPAARLDESLCRTRPTKVQSRLHSEAERRENVRGAFAVVDGSHLAGSTVLLVDDVVTTGGTISECALILREAGAAIVDVLAAALALPHETRAQSK